MAALPAMRRRMSHSWVKLSNSGEILKLLVPSNIWKNICGWINYSCMVIIQKMRENKMDYRGSKSVSGLYTPTSLKPNIVKEQRLDGSWHNDNTLCLRYNLMGLERDYQLKVLSNQIRTYSTTVNLLDSARTILSNIKLNPWFITGFADAESSFMILVQPRSDSKTKWRIKASFAIGLNKKDWEILEHIKYSLGVGRIYTSGTKVYYRVEAFNELQVILDHFDKYPLITAKKVDYALFKECFNLIKLNKHLTEEGILQIIKLKSSLNKGLSNNLKEQFKVIANERLEFKFDGISDPYWVAGFTSGDGSFNIKTTEVRSGKVQLRYAVNLHIREKDVIIGLANYIESLQNNPLKVEKVKYVHYTKTSVALQIVNLSDILDVIIPFFNKYEIQGQKRLDFNDFKKVARMLTNKEHLHEEGYNRILQIKKGMNLNRLGG